LAPIACVASHRLYAVTPVALTPTTPRAMASIDSIVKSGCRDRSTP
jgi:hypothetical protein